MNLHYKDLAFMQLALSRTAKKFKVPVDDINIQAFDSVLIELCFNDISIGSRIIHVEWYNIESLNICEF